MREAFKAGRQAKEDESFTLAAWDMLRDAEIESHGTVVITVRLSGRRGVFVLDSAVEATTGPLQARRPVKATGEYPNARAGSFAAFLFAHATSLAGLVEHAVNDAIREHLRRG